jgi:hypothetical protein
MINERRSMDEEQAQLRRENFNFPEGTSEKGYSKKFKN